MIKVVKTVVTALAFQLAQVSKPHARVQVHSVLRGPAGPGCFACNLTCPNQHSMDHDALTLAAVPAGPGSTSKFRNKKQLSCCDQTCCTVTHSTPSPHRCTVLHATAIWTYPKNYHTHGAERTAFSAQYHCGYAQHSPIQRKAPQLSTTQHCTRLLQPSPAQPRTAQHSQRCKAQPALQSTAHLQWQLPSCQGPHQTRWCSQGAGPLAAPAQLPCPSGASPVSGAHCHSKPPPCPASLLRHSTPAARAALLLLSRARLMQLALHVVCTVVLQLFSVCICVGLVFALKQTKLR